MPAPTPGVTPQPAAYLRYYPHNCSVMDRNVEALRSFAARLGVPAPALYLDYGFSCTGPRPGLGRLVRAAMNGSHRLLLVPGWWVFSVDDTQADLTVRMLTTLGGLRIVRLPPRKLVPPHTVDPLV
ncbi:hypothetical protein [Kitasatospora sp. NPDC057015]|uniref:hypothetical protein n=1 Tax=Kitasatospora sp. NPDC057015 TaxID=3346001 RepID=UPI00363A5094